ncbi:MAG: serine O-acetyltransferase EpsC [Planctomycetota bacterium]|jgi:serine O-acetyltransferase
MSYRAFKKSELSTLVKQLVKTYDDNRGINHIEGLPIPDRQAIFDVVDHLHFILFPGFTNERTVSRTNIEYLVGDALDSAFSGLSKEIETAYHYQCRLKQCAPCNCTDMAQSAAAKILKRLPHVRELLKTDVEAAYNGDPAAQSFDEIILSYPGILAISLHRIAHEIYRIGVPLIPRIIAEHAHSITGIDIHPGATIGKYFFIDHGTGVVIGETTVIGNHVNIYMGVTLGALAPAKGQSLKNVKRHPTIRDGVTIYAGATILGGETVIGKGSTIGGNVWLTKSVPAHTKVLLSNPELVFLGRKPSSEKPTDRPRPVWECPGRKASTTKASKQKKS